MSERLTRSDGMGGYWLSDGRGADCKYRGILQKVINKLGDYEENEGQPVPPVANDGWVKCSERYPDDDRDVLIRDKRRYYHVGWWCKDIWSGDFQQWTPDAIDFWCELPPSPGKVE